MIDLNSRPHPANRVAYARHVAHHDYLSDVPQFSKGEGQAIGLLVSRMLAGAPMNVVERGAERLMPGISKALRRGVLYDGMTWCLSQADLAAFRAFGGSDSVTVEFVTPCCAACEEIHGKHYTLDNVPELPIVDCTAERGCRCVYKQLEPVRSKS